LRGAPFTLYATPSHAAVAANAMFGAMTSMSRHAVNPGERFLWQARSRRLCLWYGKLPLYLEGDTPAHTESAANVGVELHREERDGIRARSGSYEECANFAAPMSCYSTALFTDDEMIRMRTGQTGRGWATCQSTGGWFLALHELSARRIFVHINNTNPFFDGSAERQKIKQPVGKWPKMAWGIVL
jgi:pyrroloquinoline quinone biosynthesis protein B